MQHQDTRVLCIDPSLRCSGWALFHVRTRQLMGVGNIRGLSSDLLLPQRFLDLHQKVGKLAEGLSLCTNDVLVCEDATTMKDPSAAMKVEQVRGIFENAARSLGVKVPGRIHPRTVHNEILGLKGKQLEREHVKSLALQAVLHLRGAQLKKLNFSVDTKNLKKNQDIIDAILLGEVVLSRFLQCEHSGASLEEILAEKRLNTKRLKALVG